MGKPQRMALVDAAWLDMEEPGNLMMITGVLWFDENAGIVPDPQRLIAEINAALSAR